MSLKRRLRRLNRLQVKSEPSFPFSALGFSQRTSFLFTNPRGIDRGHKALISEFDGYGLEFLMIDSLKLPPLRF
jgi:hypothetical protein